jgi:hypothetical protein
MIVFLRSVRRLLVRANVSSSPILVTLMKAGLLSSEMSVLTRAIRRKIPEDGILLITAMKSSYLTIHFTSPQSSSKRSILMLSTHLRLGPSSGLFPSGFATNKLCAFSFHPHSCYMAGQPYPPRLDNYNYTWRRVQIMRLLVM